MTKMLALARAYWNLIRGAKRWLAITVGLCFLGFAAGLVLEFAKPSVVDQVLEHLGGGAETGFPAFILFLRHNVFVLVVTWCGGLVLGIAPLLSIFGNGFIPGALLGVNCHGSVVDWFLTLLPHGLVEIPAILLGDAFFLRLGLRWIFQKTAADRRRAFLTDLQDSAKIGLLCVFLLVIAALLEAFATPNIQAAYAKEHLAGIGVQLATRERQLTITHVFPGGPASKAGLSSGLLIRRIDGIDTTRKDHRECGDMIHGRVGTKVKLEVIDTAQNKTNSVELVRELKP